MIIIKTNREMEMMKDAGRKLGEVFDALLPEVIPGRSTAEIDRIAERLIREKGCLPSCKGYEGFPGAVCTSVNEILIHGIPSKTVILKEGDILSVDACNADSTGYQGDACRTFAVGSVSAEASKLIRCTEECFYEAYKVCYPGRHLYEISAAIQKVATSYGYSLCKEYGGHGLGKGMHEDPFIPNYYSPELGLGPFLRVGMCIAIEPMVMAGSCEITTLKDGWGVASRDGRLTAHYENDVLITEKGPVITSVDSNVRRHLKELENNA
jgi:methionyl aminopeptidase